MLLNSRRLNGSSKTAKAIVEMMYTFYSSGLKSTRIATYTLVNNATCKA